MAPGRYRTTASARFGPTPTVLDSATARQALRSRAMSIIATQAGLLAAELEARGFLAGIGKTILFIIIILVVIGGLIGFSVARRFGQRK
jgi:hypothetical protein